MILFDNDYTEGAHPHILKRLVETNWEQAPGYGMDRFSQNAKEAIKKACGREDIAIHFLSTGTQTNLIAVAAALRPYQGVIAADSGHIMDLEAGAIEAVGHKVLPLPSVAGKLQASTVEAFVKEYKNNPANYHHVEPGMVYISNPTEVGTIYSKQEIQELRAVCTAFNMKLFMDGARLGYGLVAETNDISLKEMTSLFDLFYIGGTKLGALFGEAVVIRNEELKGGFQTLMKQKGGLLAKGRSLGIQFETLFKDNLYIENATYAVGQAMRIKKALNEKGIPLKYEAFTNQLFPILNHEQIEHLTQHFSVLVFAQEDASHDVVRLCTSWGTKVEHVDALIETIHTL